MSWNITGIGTKTAVLKQCQGYFDSLIDGCKDTPQVREYACANTALAQLIASAPEGHLLRIESWGGAGYPYLEVYMGVKLLAPTFTE